MGKTAFYRFVRSQNLLPENFTPLDRLSLVGLTGLRALVYEPYYSTTDIEQYSIDLNTLYQHTQDVLGRSKCRLKELIDLNGSSAGARPKALIGLDATKKHIITGKIT